MSRAIFEKPLAELSWPDFEGVIFNLLEEDQTLEFKETLPARDGNADAWQLGQDKIGSYARDTLAKETVAFANAYGGVIIIGIAETDEKPPRAKAFAIPLVRNCIDCVERLEPALRSVFDPPIAGFDVRAFPAPGGSGEGLVVIRVGGSTQAPHGVGRPPEAYVRRGSAKEPLTMRDLHNLFWESRTRRERILRIRDERRQFLMDLDRKKTRRPSHTVQRSRACSSF
jgi:Putative DNA-binding domain